MPTERPCASTAAAVSVLAPSMTILTSAGGGAGVSGTASKVLGDGRLEGRASDRRGRGRRLQRVLRATAQLVADHVPSAAELLRQGDAHVARARPLDLVEDQLALGLDRDGRAVEERDDGVAVLARPDRRPARKDRPVL